MGLSFECTTCSNVYYICSWVFATMNTVVVVAGFVFLYVFWRKPAIQLSQKWHLIGLEIANILCTFAIMFWLAQSYANNVAYCYIGQILLYAGSVAVLALLTVKEYRVYAVHRASMNMQRADMSKLEVQANLYLGVAITIGVILGTAWIVSSAPALKKFYFFDKHGNMYNISSCLDTKDAANDNSVLAMDILVALYLFVVMVGLFVAAFMSRDVPSVAGESRRIFLLIIVAVPILMVMAGLIFPFHWNDTEGSLPMEWQGMLFVIVSFVLTVLLQYSLIFRRIKYLGFQPAKLREKFLKSKRASKTNAAKADGKSDMINTTGSGNTTSNDIYYHGDDPDNEATSLLPKDEDAPMVID